MVGEITTRAIRTVARSQHAARAAVLLRNQCQRVIAYHLAPTHDPSQNGEHWLIRSLDIGVFVDGGANVGEWSAEMLRHAPDAQGVLIEPGVEAARRLRERFGDRFRIVEAAVGEREETLRFYEEPDASELSTFVPTGNGGRWRDVPVVTIDSLGLDRIDLLKLDVQGFEGKALRGAERMLREQRVETVQFEYSEFWRPAGDTLAGVVALLDGWGYDTFLLRPDGLDAIDGRWGEYFAFANYVAKRRS